MAYSLKQVNQGLVISKVKQRKHVFDIEHVLADQLRLG